MTGGVPVCVTPSTLLGTAQGEDVPQRWARAASCWPYLGVICSAPHWFSKQCSISRINKITLRALPSSGRVCVRLVLLETGMCVCVCVGGGQVGGSVCICLCACVGVCVCAFRYEFSVSAFV